MEYNEEDVELENEEYEIALNDNAQEPEPELFVDVKQNLHEVVSETSDNASKRNYDEMFCLSLVPDFSRLKERQKIKVKIEFMRILEDAFYNQDN